MDQGGGSARTSAALALVVSLFALVGCGGGGSTELTKAEFVAQGNKICRTAVQQKDRDVAAASAKLLAEGESYGTSRRALEDVVLNAALPPVEDMVGELGELSPPSEDEEAVAQIVSKYETALKKAEDQPANLGRVNPFTPATKAAHAYGLNECTV